MIVYLTKNLFKIFNSFTLLYFRLFCFVFPFLLLFCFVLFYFLLLYSTILIIPFLCFYFSFIFFVSFIYLFIYLFVYFHNLIVLIWYSEKYIVHNGLVAQWKRTRLRIWGLQVRSLPSSPF